eukprot:gene8248-9129_t
MTTSKAFLDVGLAERDKCILCNSITDDRYVKIKNDGLTTLNQLADRWQALDDRLCTEYPYDEFKQAKNRIPSEIGTEDVVAHSTCRVTFRTRIKRKEEQNEKLEPLPVADCDVDEATSTNPNLKISREKGRPKLLCFVCNEETNYDKRQYNKGGLGRCSEILSANKLQSQMRAKLLQENDKFYEAAKRLNIILSGAVCDIFAADIYYHKKCYANFVYSYEIKPSEEEKKIIEEEITNHFLRKFKLRAIEAKEAFLITELLKDVGEISEEYGLKEAPITLKHTYQVKAKLIEQFGDRIEFGKVGRSDVVYPSGANPLQYSLATLHGHGLREDDLVKAFAKLVNRKLSGKKRQPWPPDPKELLSSLDNSGPLRCLYNVISWSINPKREKNELGYAKTASESQAEKIAAIAECWERLITNERTPTATALSLTLHRVTGSKEATKLLHHCGMGISYTDVRLLTNKWAQAISMDHKKMLPPGFTTERSVHITFDNSDGKQQTITGDHTTHHTTGTVFQMRQPKETQVVIDNEKQPILTDEGEDEFNYGHYKIPKKRASPPSFPEFEDIYSNTDHLKKSLHKDIAWVVVGAVGDGCIKQIYPGMDGNDMAPVGSWTAFNIDTTGVETTKCKLEYLPVVPFPPTDNIIKWYMDMIMQMADDLQIEHIFAHADEAIYSKMLMISWLHKGEYDKIVPLIGGFHTVMETTFGSRKENEKAVSNLTKQLESYFNPFLDGPARHMKSGQEIHQSVVDGLLASSSVGEIAYLEFVNTRIKAPNNKVTNAQSLAIIFDSYRISTIKQLTQSRRGTPGRRVHITSMEQIMPKGKDWDAFLRNRENKIELVQALVKHYTKENNRAKLKIPLMITEEEKTWIIRQTGTEELDSSNHIEADTRIILEVSKSNRPVVVKAADTDILVLMCYAFSACQPVEEWMMKIDWDRYASISCIQNHFDLGSNDKSFGDISKAVKFFHEIIYSGNSKESITETRTKMYQKQKTKSSSSLIPDESSVAEHVKRSDLQTLIWKQCLLQNIVTPTLENRGWKEENNEIMPVWYTGNQLPPCLNKKAQKSRRKKGSSQPPTKRRKVKRSKNEHSADDLPFEDNGYEAQWETSSSEDDTFSGSDNSSSDDMSSNSSEPESSSSSDLY